MSAKRCFFDSGFSGLFASVGQDSAPADNAAVAAPGSATWLRGYYARRNVDRGGGIGVTHTLVQLFSNDLLPLRMARGFALTLLGCAPPLKNFLVRRMTFGARG